MKTRQGFVSNSSSSSFIVSFTQDPTDMNVLAEMMGNCGVHIYGTTITAEKVIETVHKIIMDDEDSKVKCPIYEEEDYSERYDTGYELMMMTPDCRDATDEEIDVAIKLKKELKMKLWCMMNNTTQAEWEAANQFLYQFTFSDENGSFWSAMEHGDVFRNVNVVDFKSHH